MAKKELLVFAEENKILNKIYIFRGQKVMIDEDLAGLYHVETKRLNEQVKRNSKRFPKDFMFTITQREFENLKSQNATSSWGGAKEAAKCFYRARNRNVIQCFEQRYGY
jgi:hypothetical protein